jgi:23S rRNA pseudouridine2605 synthase
MNDRKPKPGPGGKKKKSSYKAKRSFTRNKKIRTDSPQKSWDKPKRNFGGQEEDPKAKRSFRKELFIRKDDKAKRRNFDEREKTGRDEKFKKEKISDKPYSKEKNYNKGDKSEHRSFDKRDDKKPFSKPYGKDKPVFDKEKKYGKDDKHEHRSFDKRDDKKTFGKPFDKDKPFYKKDFSKKKEAKPTYAEKGLIRLNRYIANAGICSRREADDLIASGCVSVNGKIITELGYKIKDGDEVNYSGQRLKTEKHVYVLLNKPKDYLTTVDDDRGRRTVMELVAGACKERIYPVGRLDRNTMGLLLFTNDGEMTKKLTHPKHKVQKLYHVELAKNLKSADFVQLQSGVELEDGFIKPDEVSYSGESKTEVGVLIHSGKNRIVRRIFEKLDYDIVKLDRIMFAGLTKKDLPRGRWRMLTEKEIAFLKMI